MAKPKRRRMIEWIGGVISMPAVVTGEGEPYRPDTLIWVGADGAILGSAVGRSEEIIGLASESLQRTIEKPMFGRPHAPERVRVASPDLAAALRAADPGLEIICAPTPELDEIAASMRAHMSKSLPESENSYLEGGIGPDAVAALFRAAAGLYRAAPWKRVPADQNLISVSIERFELHEAAMTVIGQLGEAFGIVMFGSIDEFYDYLEAVDSMRSGGQAALPPHFALNFERGADLPASARKEIAAHHWEVASPTAYPWLMAVDSDATPCAPDVEEVTIAEAVSLALTLVLSEKRALEAAWAGGEPVERALTVATHAGEVEVKLRIPFEPLEDDDEEDDLIGRFANAPEGRPFQVAQWSSLLIEIADKPLTAISSADLRELVFEAIPWSVSVDAIAAKLIIAELRALYSFLAREIGLAQAEACLGVLGGDAVKELEAALGDPSKFGPAKLAYLGKMKASATRKGSAGKKPAGGKGRKKR